MISTNQIVVSAKRYLLPAALVCACVLSSLTLHAEVVGLFWILLPIAVLVSNWYAGRVAGWVAVTLSMLAVQYFYFPPLHSFRIRGEDAPVLLCFLLIQLGANWIVTWRKESEDKVLRASEALVAKALEQAETQSALQKTQADLARISRVIMVGELAASIAHEVNQPLAAVVANADACLAWLSAVPPNLEEAREAAKQAGDGAILASEVIRRIRSLINNAPAERLSVGINGIIQQTVTLTMDQALRSGVSIKMHLDPGLPAIVADKIQLQQVFLNLISNGITAMACSDPERRQLSIESHLDEQGRVGIVVSDSGVGIPEGSITKIFDPFYTTRSQGLGMGLAISRSIIESHGGRLWAESNPGMGSIFSHFPSLESVGADAGKRSRCLCD